MPVASRTRTQLRMRRRNFLISERLNLASRATMRFSSMIDRGSLSAKSQPPSNSRLEPRSIFSRHRSGKRPHSTVALGEHRRSDHDKGLHRCGAARQFTADFLGAKVLVGRQAEPSLVCDGNDRPRNFARIFGLALSRRPSPRRAFCQSHLSRHRRRANRCQVLAHPSVPPMSASLGRRAKCGL